MDPSKLQVLQPEERVLSTLDADGSRRWLYPKLAKGKFWVRRRLVAYLLIATYTLLPFINIGGRPALQLDLLNGRISFFGLVLLPNELKLLALFGLVVGLSIFFATAVMGRVWCGWACPQTVYLEYLFRPIERLFTGTVGKGGEPRKQVSGWRKPAMYAIFLLICWHLANTFLAYFVGVGNLNKWIWSGAPWQHPGAFALVLFVTGLMMFNFCYWREQLCIIGCPYGRFQSVMLDQASLVVGYDINRGEPRGHGRDRTTKGLGDCVDCGMCVDVCPTGIDIRDGLQMECVNCTQCIDACDAVMDRVHQPKGLIRYSSQAALAGKPTHVGRPRIFIYSGIIAVVATLFVTLLATRSPFHVTLLRGMGRPFVVQADGRIENTVRLKINNRTDEQQTYLVEPIAPAGLRIEGDLALDLSPLGTLTEPIHLTLPEEAFSLGTGVVDGRIRIIEQSGAAVERDYRLFGPARAGTVTN